MPASRKPVDYHPGQAKDEIIAGSIVLVLGLVITAAALFAQKETFIDWAGGLWVAPMMAFFSLIGAVVAIQGIKGLQRNKQWKRAATVVETSIVDRGERFCEEEGYDYSLALSVVPDQQAACPGETVV